MERGGALNEKFFSVSAHFFVGRHRKLQECHGKYFNAGKGVQPKDSGRKAQYTHIRIIELWKDWNQIWWYMAEGDKMQIDCLKATEENEFYDMMDLHKKKLERLKESHKRK